MKIKNWELGEVSEDNNEETAEPQGHNCARQYWSAVIGSSEKLCGRWEKGETGIVCPQQRNGSSQWYLNVI